MSCVGPDALLLYPEGMLKKHYMQIISKSSYFNDKANYRATHTESVKDVHLFQELGVQKMVLTFQVEKRLLYLVGFEDLEW